MLVGETNTVEQRAQQHFARTGRRNWAIFKTKIAGAVADEGTNFIASDWLSLLFPLPA
jgi:hypothetical protein